MSNFHHSAQDTRVDDGHILRARLQNGNGDFVDAECNLNDCLGNDNGRFDWGGRGTSKSSSSSPLSSHTPTHTLHLIEETRAASPDQYLIP